MPGAALGPGGNNGDRTDAPLSWSPQQGELGSKSVHKGSPTNPSLFVNSRCITMAVERICYLGLELDVVMDKVKILGQDWVGEQVRAMETQRERQ